MTEATVTLRCPSRSIEVTLGHGPTSPALVGGVGGMSEQTIPQGLAVVEFDGHPAYQQTLALMADGWRGRDSVQDVVRKLRRMGRAEQGERRPPRVRLSGLADRTDLPWIINGLDFDWSAAARDEDDGTTLLRVPVTVTLIHDHRAGVVVRRGGDAAAESNRRARKRQGLASFEAITPFSSAGYVVKDGDTMAAIAARLDVRGGAAAIAKLNGIRDPRSIAPGQLLRLP